jgi:hypothetical protein
MLNLLKPKSTTSQPISQPIETAAAFEETMSPPSVAEVAAETSAHAGFEVGKEYQGKVTNKKIPNGKFVYITLDNWGEPALCAVQNAADWSAGERIWCRFFKVNPAGVLIFENRDGIRRNRWRR